MLLPGLRHGVWVQDLSHPLLELGDGDHRPCRLTAMSTCNPPLCVVKSKRHAEHIEAQALSSLPGRSRGQGFRQPQTELTLEFAITAPGPFNAVGKGGAERVGN